MNRANAIRKKQTGVTRNETQDAERLKFIAPVVNPFKGMTIRHPAPAQKRNQQRFNQKDITTLPAPNPSARMTAISRERCRDRRYIVFNAPEIPPQMPITTAIIVPEQQLTS